MTWLTDFTGLGALISSIAAVIGAIHARRAASEVTPNHGGSLKDLVTAIDDKVDSLGHQVGEIRRDADTTHRDMMHRLRRLEDRDRD